MSIFGENEYLGSLGQGAPDTGRGDAFDDLASQKGWARTVQCRDVPPVNVGYLAHSHRPLGAAEFTEVQLHPPRPQRIYPGEEIDVTALQGLGAARRPTAVQAVRPGFLRLHNTTRRIMEVAVLNMGGAVVSSVSIPPTQTVGVPLPPGNYEVRFTATGRMRGPRVGGSYLGYRVSSGRSTSRISLSFN